MTQTHPIAPLWKRLFSIVYDSLILVALSLAYFGLATAISTVLLGHQPSEFKPNASGIWVQVGWVISMFGFYWYFWSRIGQTVAMKAWRLKVVNDDDTPLSAYTCILRALAGFLSLAAFGLGYLWAWVDKDGKALHDRLTHTSVILLEKGKS